VDLSGIIFVVLAFAWAAYLIPKAMKHHEEVASTRSVERFSTAMRVLARREPVDQRNARLVVTPPRTTERVLVPERPARSTEEAPAPAPRSVAARRTAARVAARRRRRVLMVLTVLDLVVGGLAAGAIVPWWAASIPVALTAFFLFLCRRQVARESVAEWAPRATASGPARPAVRIDTRYGSQQAYAEDAEADDTEDTVQIPVEELDTVAVSIETEDGGSLWDPLPVTLPTYVNKARASRSVRTIDLSAPGSWTSGRDEADTALVEQTFAPEEPAEDEVAPEPRKAVGS
jgi:hypothetical protein